ncbi:MAG TPA: hypothetical protein VK674_02865 [Candidatus Limnocylindria bacterium]|nr:hypothetical protein [Candidatus Limnocylindria bacterium]
MEPSAQFVRVDAIGGTPAVPDRVCPETGTTATEAICEVPADSDQSTPETLLDVGPWVLIVGFALGTSGAIIERRFRNRREA